MGWRSLSNHENIDIQTYLHQWLEKNPDHSIYVGCDSHNSQGKTTFAIVIVLHHQGSGGHVLYNKQEVPKVNSRYERLWKEVELSVSTTQDLMSMGIQKPDYIDIDLNPDPKYQSNSLLRAAVGLIESMGIKARYKTKSPWAISIADSICK
jgi:predicted RNase H-related nuclease YkuK (DUF458 family)